MIANGYLARWQGREYTSSPDGPLIRLYTGTPEPGFEPVGPDRYRRMVPAAEVEWFGYGRTVATLRGEPVVLLAEQGDPADLRVLVEYCGELPEGPAWWPPQQAEPGVYRAWVSVVDLPDRREERLAAPGW